MVSSVQMIPITARSKREKDHSDEYQSKAKKRSVFGDILDEVMEDMPITEFKNTTYGPNSLMNTFYYMAHEYR